MAPWIGGVTDLDGAMNKKLRKDLVVAAGIMIGVVLIMTIIGLFT